jgi:hypothetical protein
VDTPFNAALHLLSLAPAGAAMRNLGRLASCLGAGTTEIDASVAADAADAAGALEAAGANGQALAIDVAALAGAGELAIDRVAAWLHAGPRVALLLVTQPGLPVQRALWRLSRGAVEQITEAAQAQAIRFPAKPSAGDVDLAPYTFERANAPALGLALRDGAAAQVLMTLDDRPSLVRLAAGAGGSLFVWATPAVIDPDRPLADEAQFESALDQYLPAIVFLRQALGRACWHNPIVAAGIVVDDPLLVRRYGFLDFSKVLGSARANGWRLTLAFIPWNHWRVARRSGPLFSQWNDVFSVCVHGSDHTRHEFDSADDADLLGRSALALRRMSALVASRGLRLDAVMVYPQEKYSYAAVQALADSGGFAAITNTRQIPTSGSGLAVTAADLLAPAQDCLHGMPIFKRHYFTSMRDFSLSLYLGRPAIMACHHTDFRDGAAKAEAFAAELSRIAATVRWWPLEEMTQRVHWRRWTRPDALELRFFGNTFLFDSETSQPCAVTLTRRVPQQRQVRTVMLDGTALRFTHAGGFVVAEVPHCAAGPHRVSITWAPSAAPVAVRRSLRYECGVALRRVLSELRDRAVTVVSGQSGR